MPNVKKSPSGKNNFVEVDGSPVNVKTSPSGKVVQTSTGPVKLSPSGENVDADDPGLG
jgi:hypothetical protein